MVLDFNEIPEQVIIAWQERIALVEIILDESISDPDKKQVVKEYCEKHSVGERMIRNYLLWYKQFGPERLLFFEKKEAAPRITDQMLREKIIELINERPTRSVRTIRNLLFASSEFREKIQAVSDRTVYRFLFEQGLTKKRRYAMAGENARTSYHQFQAAYPMELVQGDARDGIWITLPDGKKKKTYLFAWIDDYSRKILYAEYYWDEKLPRMEDTFKKMILRWGIMIKLYLDYTEKNTMPKNMLCSLFSLVNKCFLINFSA